ncbi:MAG: 3-deoxy-D-manno-octulosonic acid transferase [Candidatus Omnitrophica bacterium]|nr:3-deoxy-D-manno-octulosonic acid transferase [Candidatus Omnitrophota bacterium]
MMRTFFYDLAFMMFAVFYAPIFLMKLRQAEDPHALWRERRGIFPASWSEKFRGKKVVWLHAVSVGEVMAVEKFFQEWFAASGEYDFVLTTVTPTGQRIARRFEGERVHVCYFPFDLRAVAERFFGTFNPVCLLLVETEVWPNVLAAAARRDIPVGMINARLSERSLERYRTFSWVFRPFWKQLKFVLAQTAEDAERFRRLGVPSEAVRDMGNMKFDQSPASDRLKGLPTTVPNNPEKFERGLGQVAWTGTEGADTAGLREAWGCGPGDLVWIAGSTHPGEEEVLAKVFTVLRPRFPALKLILAPRHIERSRSLLKRMQRFSFKTVLSTQRKEGESFDILVLDRVGLLKNLYLIADLVFMGGSLVPHGGQNPIEAARFEKAILHGPHVFNFQKIYRELDRDGGALEVPAQDELSSAAAEFLAQESRRHEAGRKAFQTVNRLRGASKRQAGWILSFLASRPPRERIVPDGQTQKLFSAVGRGQTL